jgi:hypothetical protein
MQMLAIFGMCILASVLYGIVHDQITVRVCLEYFTIGHPPVFDTQSPTLLALGWGVIASWWGGAILGAMLAFAARLGNRPKYTARMLVKPVVFLLGTMGLFAAISGVIGYTMAGTGNVILSEEAKRHIPHAKWAAFQACWFAHTASYYVAFMGGSMQVVWVAMSRKRLRPSSRVAGYPAGPRNNTSRHRPEQQ